MNTMGAAHGPSPTTRPDGTTVWRTHGGSIHRADGPAIIHPDGSLEWWFHGNLHRVGGPAATRPNGIEEWWFHGNLHRVGGPAVTWPDGSLEWHEHGVRKEPEVEAVLTMLWRARTEDSEASK